MPELSHSLQYCLSEREPIITAYFAAADLALEIKVGMTASSSDSASSSSLSSSPVVSSLSIDDVSGLHSGNYTCAPSNARAAAIVVHVVDGEWPEMSCDVDGDMPLRPP